MDFQKTQLDMAAKQAELDYAKARRLASLLIALAVAVALGIAVFTTRETAHEISARIAAKNEVSNLNATLEARVSQRTHDLYEASKRLELQSAALEAAANAIVITDVHGTIMWVNPCLHDDDWLQQRRSTGQECSSAEIRRAARRLLCQTVGDHLIR